MKLSTAYKLCKSSIDRNTYEYEDMMGKLDLFVFAGRITEEQYLELIELMDKQEALKQQE